MTIDSVKNCDENPATGPIRDPVSWFEVPEEWIERSGDPCARDKIRTGRWVLLSDGRMLVRGYTTGTTSAAACKGAVLSLALEPAERLEIVDVMTPAGIRVSLTVEAKAGICRAVKDGGDHRFDITNGIEVLAKARESERIELIAGEGIGSITAGGLCAPQGKSAISQSARQQIIKAIEEGLVITGLKGAAVELTVPRGREIAILTLNPKVGVADGISILGSTGFVEPWNDHLAISRSEEIKGLKKVLATTGRTGLKYSRILFPDHQAVLLGSHLDKLQFAEGQDSILCGMPALIIRWAWPEVLEGTGYRTVAEMVEREPEHPCINTAIEKARARLPYTRIVLLHKDGRILRDLGQ
ncbi:Cobalt-precorrin-5B C(1)-methyltransferase [uncultured archaeon]|nr:Cobalt-precorrin-5B C(1)-methyltransferase [uncultured archaeon]